VLHHGNDDAGEAGDVDVLAQHALGKIRPPDELGDGPRGSGEVEFGRIAGLRSGSGGLYRAVGQIRCH
jgi:hypothetical protein